jgi:hypothetical protein
VLKHAVLGRARLFRPGLPGAELALLHGEGRVPEENGIPTLEDAERAEATMMLDRLVGHAAWSICPCCRQSADRDDEAYVRRAQRFVGAVES